MLFVQLLVVGSVIVALITYLMRSMICRAKNDVGTKAILLTISQNDDNNGTDTVNECAACGKGNATKRCRKRHGGCADKRYCDADCERLGHVKEKAVELEDDKGNVEAAVETIDDAAIAKMRKKKKEDRKLRKLLKRRGVAHYSNTLITTRAQQLRM